MGEDEPPPSYDEAVYLMKILPPPEPEEEDIDSVILRNVDAIFNNRAPSISTLCSSGDDACTGPTKYKGNRCLFVVACIYIVAQCVAKILIGVYVVAKFCYRPERCIEDCPTYCTFQLVGHVFNAFNFWPIAFMRFDRYKTLKRYSWREGGWYTKAFFFYCLDNTVLFAITAGSLTMHDKSPLVTAALSCMLLCTLNTLLLGIVTGHELMDYDPCASSNRYSIVQRYNEHFREDKPLTIEKSTPFRISISYDRYGRYSLYPQAGASNIEWNPLTVTREVYTHTKKSHEEPKITCEKVTMQSKCYWSDNTMTLIPETHTLRGAVRVKGLRSFGDERGLRVVTTILDASQNPIVRLVEVYK